MHFILGSNDNPSAYEFKSIYRKLLTCHQIVYRGHRANCISNETGVLTVSSRQLPQKPSQGLERGSNRSGDGTDFDFDYMAAIHEDIEKFDEHLNALIASSIENTIWKKLEQNTKLECEECKSVFIENQKIDDSLISMKIETKSCDAHQPCRSTVGIIFSIICCLKSFMIDQISNSMISYQGNQRT